MVFWLDAAVLVRKNKRERERCDKDNGQQIEGGGGWFYCAHGNTWGGWGVEIKEYSINILLIFIFLLLLI